MRQKPDSGTEHAEVGAKAPSRRFDLSLPQVAGSALAAVAAAVLASRLGVYGTIIGAGVVSVVATCGGSVFQHLFRRTGEQIRVVTVQAKPGGRRIPVRNTGGETSVLTGPLPPVTSPNGEFGDGEFSEATTHGTRVRGWKRPALAAVVVFLVAMIGITAFELASGQEVGGGRGTTVGSVVGGGGGGSAPSQDHGSTPDTDRDQDGTPGHGGGTEPSRTPDGGHSAGTGQNGGEPQAPLTPRPSHSPGGTAPSPSAPAPAPSAPSDPSTPGDPAGGGANGGASGGGTGGDSGGGANTPGAGSGTAEQQPAGE
ncbi:hypothetical protein [Streptomyces sp. NPDC088725]|uniref:hypothetical protein n=1 Tax=Streptomyces sp. NPDC088725 TaxID=3365873 RepID=UPI00382C79E0